MVREGLTAPSKENLKVNRTFSGFHTIDLTYNEEDPNNWVITDLRCSKKDYEKYLQFRQEDGTFDELVSLCTDLPSVRIFDIVDTPS